MWVSFDDSRLDVIGERGEQVHSRLMAPIEVRLSARWTAIRLMRTHALEWLPAIPAQNAFCGAI